jgi:hypothetical protein
MAITREVMKKSENEASAMDKTGDNMDGANVFGSGNNEKEKKKAMTTVI